MSPRFDRLHQRFLTLDLGARILVLFLLLTAAGLAWHLASAAPPWDPAVQERFMSGNKLRASDYATKWGWVAAAANLILCAGLLASVGFWGKALKPAPGYVSPASPTRSGIQTFVVGLCMALVVAAVFRVPRLAHSFWNDEEYAFRRFTWGEMKPAKDGDGLRYDEPT